MIGYLATAKGYVRKDLITLVHVSLVGGYKKVVVRAPQSFSNYSVVRDSELDHENPDKAAKRLAERLWNEP
jgi:hypothetical protein